MNPSANTDTPSATTHTPNATSSSTPHSNTSNSDNSNTFSTTTPTLPTTLAIAQELLTEPVMDNVLNAIKEPRLAASNNDARGTVLNPAGYGAHEIKLYINKATLRGFSATLASVILLLGGYTVFINASKSSALKGVTVNKMKLTQLPPPPASDEATPPPPPPTTIAGPAARAGTPVPVPDALVTPDMKDFASVEDVSRASSTGGDGNDQGFLGLSKDVDVEVRENEPDAYDFLAVEKEPYIDLEDLQKRVVYPEIARRAGIEGKVNVRVLVGKNGKPKKYLIESTDSSLLDEAAVKAVMNSTFTPAILANQPIDCWVSIPINFRMR